MESLDPRIVVGVLVALAVVVIAFVLMQKRRSDELRGKFGPEYDRLVHERGDARHAESELSHRVERVKQLQIRPISREQRERFAEARTGLDHFGLAVPTRADLEAWQAHLQQLGVQHSPIADRPYGSVLVFRDPDNIQLELFAPASA